MWTEEQFQAWKASPDNEGFFRFLKDARQALMERWAEGEPMDPATQALAVAYGDMAGLNWAEDVAPFYGTELNEGDEEDDSE